jgi:hypothetical protein
MSEGLPPVIHGESHRPISAASQIEMPESAGSTAYGPLSSCLPPCWAGFARSLQLFATGRALLESDMRLGGQSSARIFGCPEAGDASKAGNETQGQTGLEADSGHNGAVITLLAISALTHRQSYKEIFAITAINTLAVFFVIAGYYMTGLVQVFVFPKEKCRFDSGLFLSDADPIVFPGKAAKRPYCYTNMLIWPNATYHRPSIHRSPL